MLFEVTDRGQRVVRAELHPARGQGDELHRDLRLQRPVVAAAPVRGGGAVEQLAGCADVDLAGGHPLLDRPEAADQLAELAAGLGVLDGHLMRALGRGQRPGGQAEPEQGHVLSGARRRDLSLRFGGPEGDRAPGGDGQAGQRAARADRAERRRPGCPGRRVRPDRGVRPGRQRQHVGGGRPCVQVADLGGVALERHQDADLARRELAGDLLFPAEDAGGDERVGHRQRAGHPAEFPGRGQRRVERFLLAEGEPALVRARRPQGGQSPAARVARARVRRARPVPCGDPGHRRREGGCFVWRHPRLRVPVPIAIAGPIWSASCCAPSRPASSRRAARTPTTRTAAASPRPRPGRR